MAAPEVPATGGGVFCRECGKAIEADARFCRFCGTSQGESPTRSVPLGTAGSRSGPSSVGTRSARNFPAVDLERRLRQIFPRYHSQDEFMHIGTIAAFAMAVIGFVLGFFLAYSWLAIDFLLAAIALLLFLMVRESTLSQIRSSGKGMTAPQSRPPSAGVEPGRASGPRRASSAGDVPAEVATAESSPPSTPR